MPQLIKLTVMLPAPDGHSLHPVVAYYDDTNDHWLCEDARFYRVLKNFFDHPDDMAYLPDEGLERVNRIARMYHGEVEDQRKGKKHQPQPGEVY